MEDTLIVEILETTETKNRQGFIETVETVIQEFEIPKENFQEKQKSYLSDGKIIYDKKIHIFIPPFKVLEDKHTVRVNSEIYPIISSRTFEDFHTELICDA